MLIQKGGITRRIDETRLHEYGAKGYAIPVVAKEPAPNVVEEVRAAPPAGGKPIERMTTAELTQKAAELGVDISGATTNKQRVAAILAAQAKE